jgi:N-acetylmuramoyl-L-alanine amidase
LTDYKLDVVWAAGHGHTDPGAVAGTRKEKDYNLKRSLYCHARALELGLRSGISRRDDSWGDDLEQQAARVTISQARICVCQHINAGGGRGAEVFHSLRHSPKFGQIMMEQLKAAGCGAHGVGVKTKASAIHKNKDGSPKDYYRMHYTGITETLIVEPGFIDDSDFMAFLDARFAAVCEAEIKAVCLYLGKTYSAPGAKSTPVAKVPGPNKVRIVVKKTGHEFVGKLENSKTQGPVGDIARDIGLPVDWDPNTNTVTLG